MRILSQRRAADSRVCDAGLEVRRVCRRCCRGRVERCGARTRRTTTSPSSTAAAAHRRPRRPPGSRQHDPELPVVILSARSDLPTKLRGFELGANDYVVKPFSLDELIAASACRLRHAAGLVDGHVVQAAGSGSTSHAGRCGSMRKSSTSRIVSSGCCGACRAFRRGDQPRAPARAGVGYTSIHGRTSSKSRCGGCGRARRLRHDRNGAACGYRLTTA